MELEPLPLPDTELGSPSLLHCAIKERNIQVLKDLINANVGLNYRTEPYGYTALILAVTEIECVSNGLYFIDETKENKMKEIKILEEIIKLLLEAGCNANIPDDLGRTPIYWAVQNGLKKVIEMIIFYTKEDTLFQPIAGMTLLHVTVMASHSSPTADFNSCLDLLLKYSLKINVNHLDYDNNTALHYAVMRGDDDIVLKLLRHGACVSLRNNRNELALEGINARTLETYLDECIRTSGKLKASDYDYYMYINYKFLFNTNLSHENKIYKEPTLTSETDALLYMTQNEELRPLLKHPVITSFLYLKWHRIRYLSYANITTYSILWLFLIQYIIFGYGVEKEQSDSFQTFNSITYVVVMIGLIVLIIREFFQLLLSPVRYLLEYENWIEILLIVIITWIVCHDSEHVFIKQQLSAVAILISSMELLLLLGQIPASSTNMLMLKTVSWNFFKFLLWYCILIIAFALSFYTLFREVKNNQTPPSSKLNTTDKVKNVDLFKDPLSAIFKTIVMMTGEFGAESIPFNTFPITSHIIFIVFVFMIPIVLFNLLNGLAISDTQKIRADAELVALIARVKIMSYFENLLIGNTKACNKPTKCWSWLTTRLQVINTCQFKLRALCIKLLAKYIFLFPHIFPEIIVKLNQDNKITSMPTKVFSKLHGKIVENAKFVINKKKNVTELDEIKAVLIKSLDTINKNLETKIESLHTTNKSLKTKLESLDATNKSLETKLESLDTTNKSLETKLESLKATNKNLEKKIENVERILNRVIQSLERMSE